MSSKSSPGLHSCGQAVEEVVRFPENGCLDVEHRHEDGHETSHCHRGHQLPVRMEGVESQCALPQMYKTLGIRN